ncbi:MAG: glycosyltransferase family 4 protein [Opitutaceae bacterium]|nr:glycosyltransferase family 4 protein [Opitutaceae bacterium]
MRIAFISYEFPPHSSLGGIATYVAQVASLLTARGHAVEVFCGLDPAANGAEADTDSPAFRIHRIRCSRAAFPQQAERSFAARHTDEPFDVLEGPDFLAEALPTAVQHPRVPFVVRLHTPWRIITEINTAPPPIWPTTQEIRHLWYCLRTGKPLARKPVDPLFAMEEANARRADLILSPSAAIGHRVQHLWRLDPNRIVQVGLPFQPSDALLAIPTEGNHHRVTYVGRLEWRKGVQDFAAAIPAVLKAFPSTKFRFVGADTPSPIEGETMSASIKRAVGQSALTSLEFTGAVPPAELPQLFRHTDVCVFPSRWESFGYVLLEAMAAGRACICTSGSGLAEIAGQGQYARLVPPAAPPQLARAVCDLLRDPALRVKMGTLARAEGLRRYEPGTVLGQQVDAYQQAIANHRRHSAAQPK